MTKDHVSIDVSPKNGSIDKIEISPKGTYLVAAIRNDQDHKIQEIIGWNVKDIKEGQDIIEENEDIEKEDEYIEKFEGIEQEGEKVEEVKNKKRKPIYVDQHDKTHICVSDDKILAYIGYRGKNTSEFSKYY